MRRRRYSRKREPRNFPSSSRMILKAVPCIAWHKKPRAAAWTQQAYGQRRSQAKTSRSSEFASRIIQKGSPSNTKLIVSSLSLPNKKVCSSERSHTLKNAQLRSLPHKLLTKTIQDGCQIGDCVFAEARNAPIPYGFRIQFVWHGYYTTEKGCFQ